MKQSQNIIDHWLTVLRKLHQRLRRLSFIGVLVFVVVVIEIFSSQLRLSEEERLFRTTISELSTKEEFVDEARKYVETCDCGRVGVPIYHLPKFSEAVEDKVHAQTQDRSYRLGSFEMPLAPYQLILLVAPLILFASQLQTIYQVRSIHKIIIHNAKSNGLVQQVLNSIFYERVTKEYGERPLVHAITIAVINFPLLLSTFLFIPSSYALALSERRVVLNLDGSIEGPVKEVLVSSERIDDMMMWWYILLIIVIALWLLVSFFASKAVKDNLPSSVKKGNSPLT